LEVAQRFLEEKVISSCNKSIKDNYERHILIAEQTATRRNGLLLEMTGEGKKPQKQGLMGLVSGFLNK